MRLVSRTGRSYRLVTVFSLIWFLLSLVTSLTKKLNLFSAYIVYILMYYTRSNARGIHLVLLKIKCTILQVQIMK
jgi:hypothetical protein